VVTLGEDFVAALSARSGDQLRAVLAPDVDFKALTPGRFWEATDADAVVDDIILGKWFEDSDHIRDVVDVQTGVLPDSERVGYLLRVDNADGEFLVEQQAYYEQDDGRISWMRVVCSGYRRSTTRTP
jgi:hypothetical protein